MAFKRRGKGADVEAMRRLIAIALVGAAVFAAVTVYREGTDRAFGGALAPYFAPVDREDTSRPLAAMQRVHDKTSDRTNRALGDERFRDDESKPRGH
jgi:hypothetical protein